MGTAPSTGMLIQEKKELVELLAASGWKETDEDCAGLGVVDDLGDFPRREGVPRGEFAAELLCISYSTNRDFIRGKIEK